MSTEHLVHVYNALTGEETQREMTAEEIASLSEQATPLEPSE